MWLHLVDNSGDRGQYAALVEAGYRSHLLSYAHRGAERLFASAWEKMMYLHLANSNGVPECWVASAEAGHRSSLLSYEYKNTERAIAAGWGHLADKAGPATDRRARVLIDSGAFTAFTQGKLIRPEEYAEWAHGFRGRWSEKLAFLRFFNLDVIGDQDASWKNQAVIERAGIPVIPIVTYGADLKHVERALEYDYFALGGLVPYAKDRERLGAWLDRCFAVVTQAYRRRGVMPKVHLLGIAQKWAIERYPCYSSDVSSWISGLRFGKTSALGSQRSLPKYAQAREVNIYSLRHEVQKYQAMERGATALWARRGITWTD
jgi:hypothetical protein